MRVSDIKATFYDLVSYLFSGLLFLLTIYIAFLHQTNSNLSLTLINKASATQILFILFGSYIIGHFIATLSSLLIERWIFKKSIEKNLTPSTILSDQLHDLFIEKYTNLFKSDFNNKDFRLIICYVESNQPSIYSTAFVFLSIYGMCRNYAVIFLLSAIAEMIIFINKCNFIVLAYVLLYIVASGVFLLGYHRFIKYFKQEIINGFLLPKE